jgi:hypothetical protein
MLAAAIFSADIVDAAKEPGQRLIRNALLASTAHTMASYKCGGARRATKPFNG